MSFNPYNVEKIGNKFYVRVLIFNNQRWHPWRYLYICSQDSPVPSSMIEYAKEFLSESEAEKFIESILKE